MKVPVDLKPVDKFSQTMFSWDMPGEAYENWVDAKLYLYFIQETLESVIYTIHNGQSILSGITINII
jgi:hypothetical protein